ncbi:MAG: hypothetical protein LZF86_110055 [Nitrospira sp.]|nr:MAG: hypothetical protein LZF86_110055 [Nitrospira sp.]
MDWIAERFQDCLCPACLKQVSLGGLVLPVSKKNGHAR